jgi:hypothetical protein
MRNREERGGKKGWLLCEKLDGFLFYFIILFSVEDKERKREY